MAPWASPVTTESAAVMWVNRGDCVRETAPFPPLTAAGCPSLHCPPPSHTAQLAVSGCRACGLVRCAWLGGDMDGGGIWEDSSGVGREGSANCGLPDIEWGLTTTYLLSPVDQMALVGLWLRAREEYTANGWRVDRVECCQKVLAEFVP